MIFAALAVLAACASDDPATAPRRRASLSVSGSLVAASACQIGMRVDTVITLGVTLYWIPPTRDSTCDVQWELNLNYVDIPVAVGYRGPTFITAMSAPVPARHLEPTIGTNSMWGVQNGPIKIQFMADVDQFTSDIATLPQYHIDHPGLWVFEGPATQRIVAYNGVNAVLIDTLGGMVTAITRAGIRRVEVYPSLTGTMFSPTDTSVYKRWYTMSFRPDSSCPPVADPILNQKEVRDAMRQLVVTSNAATPWREEAIAIATDSSGTKFFPVYKAQPAATGCSNPIANNLPNMPAGGVQWVALGHSHMNEGGWVANCPSAPGGGFATNLPTGGLSPADWDVSESSAVYVYAITTDGFVDRTDRITRGKQANAKFGKAGNPNRWRVGARGCFQ